MDWIEANGASLRYDLSGSGSATVVAIHEVGGCIESWDDAIAPFQRRFRVLRYDQRGFGMSERTRTITMDGIVADLVALLDGLQIVGPVHLVGCAMGAAIALAFAGRHPGRVGRIVTASPATWANADPAVARKRIDEIERAGVRAVEQGSLAASYPEVMRVLDRARFERFRRRWLANDPEAMAAILRMSTNPSFDLSADLARIAAPTLVVGCTHDPIRTPAMAGKVAAQIPGAKYVEASSGHFMAIETPELFAELAVPFLTAGAAGAK
ncbi:MAG: alpha/beta hydrolase [Candidatus Rokuibacteriota bacterium]|nr:MAG: alpha/beta hydrolase [Candidatus Rokubacteria bacterium]